MHSGPEPDRHTFDAVPTERDLWETYLPAFRDLVQDGQAASVMSAYNRINGESATASQRFLNDILRDQWGFKGYVVSDCGAVDDIFRRHKIVPTAEEASAIAVKRGCDLECGSTYRALKAAVEKGLLRESDLDVALLRLFEARFRLGMFDPPERVRWAQTPYTVNDSPAHDTLARRVAQSSMVLLKNTRRPAAQEGREDGRRRGTHGRPSHVAARQLQRHAVPPGHDPGRHPRGGLARHEGAVRTRRRPRGRPARSEVRPGGRHGIASSRRPDRPNMA